MKSKWNSKLIEEIDFLIGDGNYSSKYPKSSEFKTSGIPFFSASDIKNGRLHLDRVRYIAPEQHAYLKKGHIKKDDVLIVTRGNGCGGTALVDNKFKDCNINAQLVLIREGNEVNGKYLYYYMTQLNKSGYIQGFITGSAQPQLPIKNIKKIAITIPPLPTQKKIAHILSTLDDKIELNRKMNQTLEEMAQALFKSWFVDFDPVHAKAKCSSDEELNGVAKELGISKEILDLFPSEFEESELGMIPKEWKVSTIENEVTIYGGGTPSTKEEKFWVDGDNYWATPRDLSNLQTKVLIDTGRMITDEGVNKISSKQLPIGTILLSSRAPVGYIAFSTIPISINQGFIAMVCNQRVSNYFIMYWLDIAMSEIKNRAIGTTFSEISKSSFRPIKLVIAKNEILKAFDALVIPIVNKLIENEQQLITLKQIRDTLLPKLLSGELDISELDLNME